MSSFKQWTMHPDTHHWHEATWHDNYFGGHKYGVEFNDGKIFDPEKVDLQTAERKRDIPKDEIIDNTKLPEFRYMKRITKEEIDDLVTAALEGGITYWCGEVRVKGKYDGYASEQISKGGTIKLYDAEQNVWHQLDINKLLKGLSLYNGSLEDVDSVIADAVIQYALFGKQVYA